MPFSSLSDPVELARAQAALDAACVEILSDNAEANCEQVRIKLAYIIAALSGVVEDEKELTRRAVASYRHSRAD